MNLYEIVYLEGEFGTAVTTTERGNTEEEAVDEAKTDYYFWKLVHVNLIEEGVSDD